MVIMPSPRTGKVPQIHEDVFIAPNATIIGDVHLDEGANVWFNAVLRGDWGTIKIGKNTSVQEHCAVHVEVGTECIIGSNCIVGHHSVVHGPCVIEDGCLIGMGARVINKAKIGKGSLIGAGAVVTNTEIPERSLAVGIPAKVKKTFTDKGKLIGMKTTGEYAKNGREFKKFFQNNPEYLK